MNMLYLFLFKVENSKLWLNGGLCEGVFFGQTVTSLVESPLVAWQPHNDHMTGARYNVLISEVRVLVGAFCYFQAEPELTFSPFVQSVC